MLLQMETNPTHNVNFHTHIMHVPLLSWVSDSGLRLPQCSESLGMFGKKKALSAETISNYRADIFQECVDLIQSSSVIGMGVLN